MTPEQIARIERRYQNALIDGQIPEAADSLADIFDLIRALKAARLDGAREMQERCAQVAIKQSRSRSLGDEPVRALMIAAAIRALKPETLV